MKSKEVLKILKVTRPTLCRYVRDGKLHVTQLPNGFYDYSDEDVFRLANISTNRSCVIYTRVSTQKQKKDLQNQIESIRKFANEKGFIVDKVYSDIASGLSFDRGSFQGMLKEVLNYQIKTVFISNKDRLTRVSFDMWKQLFSQFSCELIVINQDETATESSEKEIFEDIISLTLFFNEDVFFKEKKENTSYRGGFDKRVELCSMCISSY